MQHDISVLMNTQCLPFMYVLLCTRSAWQLLWFYVADGHEGAAGSVCRHKSFCQTPNALPNLNLPLSHESSALLCSRIPIHAQSPSHPRLPSLSISPFDHNSSRLLSAFPSFHLHWVSISLNNLCSLLSIPVFNLTAPASHTKLQPHKRKQSTSALKFFNG